MENEQRQGKWNEAEWGKLAYRSFDKCPNCGCPARYSVEALREDIPEEAMKVKPPAMGSFEFICHTALYRIHLVVVYDSCCKCGMIYTVARSKTKQLLGGMVMKGDMPPFIGRG